MTKRYPGRPRKTNRPECSVVGCSKAGKSRGLCSTHYMAWKRGQLNEDGTEARPKLRVSSYGSGAHCSVEGCARRPKGNGLCHAHWQRQKGGQDLGPPVHSHYQGKFVPCLLSDCSKRATSKGMCQNHAEQRRRGLIDDVGNKLRDKQKPGRPRKAERYNQDGYILVWAPEGHLRAQANGKIYEHRLVMEQTIGRYLEEWELVHHKDGDRSNNDISNLQLLDGRSKKHEGHPPGSEMDYLTALQVVAQSKQTPSHVVHSVRKFQQLISRTLRGAFPSF